MSLQHQTTCEHTRGRFHAYRGGGLSELERASVAKHLDVCAACRAELWLQAQLEDSAKQRPAPLSDGQKSAILERVHEVVGARDCAHEVNAMEWREKLARWFAPPSFALPRLALAGAFFAVLAVVAFEPWRSEDARVDTGPAGPLSSMASPASASVARATGVVANAGGVHAIALAPSAVKLERGVRGDALSVSAGRVAIEFDRRVSSGPLRVELPQGVAIVRGTVLVVSVEGGRSRVAVRHGLVEVQPAGHGPIFVRAGEEISFGEGAVVTGLLGPAEADELEALWPGHDAAVSAAAAASSERASSAVMQHPVEAKKSLAREPAAVPVALEVALAEARALEVGGERRTAIERLEGALASTSGAEPGLVEEARYRIASLYRAAGELARAAEVLGMIAGSSGVETAQLASLERGRVLVELGALAEGIAALRVAARGQGPVADDALAAVCVALARDPSLVGAADATADCVREHLARFPKSPHRVAVDELLVARATPTRER